MTSSSSELLELEVVTGDHSTHQQLVLNEDTPGPDGREVDTDSPIQSRTECPESKSPVQNGTKTAVLETLVLTGDSVMVSEDVVQESQVQDLPDNHGDQVTDRVIRNVDSPEVVSSSQQMVVPNGDTISCSQECGESKSTAVQLTNNLLFDLD